MSSDLKRKIFFSSVVASNATFITTKVPHQPQNKPTNLFTFNTSMANHPKSNSSNNTISSNSNKDSSPKKPQTIIFNSINIEDVNKKEEHNNNINQEQKFRFRKVFHIQKTKNINIKQATTNQNDNNLNTNINPPQFTTIIPSQQPTHSPTSSSNNEPSKIFYINKKTKRSSNSLPSPKQQETSEPKPIAENIIIPPSSLGNIKLTNPKNDVYIDDLKEKIQNTYNNQNALDLRMIKLYHQLLMEQQQQIYITPDNSSSEEENSPSSKKKYKIIMGFSKKVHCNCKKSNCLKNYCECKRNHERCDKKCVCEQCKNLSKNN